LVAVRGQLLICISLVRLLELDNEHTLPGTRETNFARLLVVSSPEGPVVFPVSEVASISRYRDTDLRPVPATLPSAGKRFTKAVLPWQTKCRSGKNVTTEEVSASLLDEQGLCEHINRSLS
jgi:chemotaxis signal transduction protein